MCCCCCCYYYYYYYYHHHHSCFHLYAWCLQLCTWNKPCFSGIQCCSCSVFTVCATCNVIWHVKHDLYLYISTSHSLCAVPKMPDFCSFSISCCPGILLRYFLSDFEMVPVAPVITGTTFPFIIIIIIIIIVVVVVGGIHVFALLPK